MAAGLIHMHPQITGHGLPSQMDKHIKWKQRNHSDFDVRPTGADLMSTGDGGRPDLL